RRISVGERRDAYVSKFSSRGNRGAYVSIYIGERRAAYSSICVKISSGNDAAYAAPYASIFHQGSGAAVCDTYVSNSIEERRGGYSSICVNFYRGATRRMQLHMCHFLSGSDAARIAPYVSNFCQGAARRV
ncbi:MAG TPA: hypothetical protein P5322_13180, partial [Spirochaetota bacterium]|nr:hypothetical protein [Spirochaetota bacterium]